MLQTVSNLYLSVQGKAPWCFNRNLLWQALRERERENLAERLGERERERERALLGAIHNGGSRAAPASGLRIITLWSASPYTLDGVAAYMAKTFLGL